MRAAPPVDLLLAPGRVERGLIVALHGLCGLALSGWASSWLWPQAPVVGVLAVLSCGTALSGWLGWCVALALLPVQAERLGWSGQFWFMRLGDAVPLPLLAVQARIDLGHWVLLRCQLGDGKPCWRVASVRHDASAWHLFRVALQAHGGAEAADRSAAP